MHQSLEDVIILNLKNGQIDTDGQIACQNPSSRSMVLDRKYHQRIVRYGTFHYMIQMSYR